MAKPTKHETFEDRRPHCPNCTMRMMSIKMGDEKFECFRCGYVGAVITKDQAAE